MNKRFALIVALAAGLIGGTLGSAGAQTFGGPPPPRFGVDSRYFLRGRVESYGGYGMQLRVDGQDLHVALHPGTVILPTGLSLRPGMRVSIDGYWNRGSFDANRIVWDR